VVRMTRTNLALAPASPGGACCSPRSTWEKRAGQAIHFHRQHLPLPHLLGCCSPQHVTWQPRRQQYLLPSASPHRQPRARLRVRGGPPQLALLATIRRATVAMCGLQSCLLPYRCFPSLMMWILPILLTPLG